MRGSRLVGQPMPSELAETAGWRARGRNALAHWLPPARVTWLVLATLGGYEVAYFHGMGLASILGLPVLALVVDLAFQRVRFTTFRVPDAALTTGAFVALLLPPTVPLVWAGAAAVVAIAAKHVVRRAGRPWMNPAAFGTVVGIALFGLAPAWWVAVNPTSEIIMLVGGAILLARTPGNWRLPTTFFVVYAALWIATRFALQLAASPQVLLLGLADPVMLFFGLYMVSEPRTAPRRPPVQVPYAAFIGLTGVTLNFVLPNEGPLAGLLLVGLAFGIGAWAYDARYGVRTPRARGDGAARRPVGVRASRSLPAAASSARWSIGPRIAASFLVLVLLGGVLVLAPPGATFGSAGLRGLPPGGSGGAGSQPPLTEDCAADNPAIPSSTLSVLHQALGPSVILSYDPSTGETLFYDPVDHVTVTETDLYEDYGYAEFNGDDYAVSGCHP